MKPSDKEIQAFVLRAQHEDQDVLTKELNQKEWDKDTVKYVHFKWIDIYAEKEKNKGEDETEFFGMLFGFSLIGLGVFIFLVFYQWSGDAIHQDAEAQTRVKWMAFLLVSIGFGVIGKEKIYNRESPSNPKRKKGKFNPFIQKE